MPKGPHWDPQVNKRSPHSQLQATAAVALAQTPSSNSLVKHWCTCRECFISRPSTPPIVLALRTLLSNQFGWDLDPIPCSMLAFSPNNINQQSRIQNMIDCLLLCRLCNLGENTILELLPASKPMADTPTNAALTTGPSVTSSFGLRSDGCGYLTISLAQSSQWRQQNDNVNSKMI